MGNITVEAVKVMTSVAREIEKDIKADAKQNLVRINNEVTAVLAMAAVRATSKVYLLRQLLLVDTLTGRTGRYLSSLPWKYSCLCKML